MVNTAGPWQVLRTGTARSLRHWPIWLLFFGLLVLLAGLLLIPLAGLLSDWLGHRVAVQDLAEGLNPQIAGDLLHLWNERNPTVDGILAIARYSLRAWPFLLALPFVILTGGALSIYREGDEALHWPRFWRGLARCAGPFTLILLLQTLVLEGTLNLGLLLLGRAAGGASLGLAALVLIVVVVALLLVQWWFEYARVLVVMRQQRHVLRILSESAAFLRRHVGPITGLAFLSGAISLLPLLLYVVLTQFIPPGWWPLRVLLQQMLLLGRVGIKLIRLSAELELVNTREEGMSHADAIMAQT